MTVIRCLMMRASSLRSLSVESQAQAPLVAAGQSTSSYSSRREANCNRSHTMAQAGAPHARAKYLRIRASTRRLKMLALRAILLFTDSCIVCCCKTRMLAANGPFRLCSGNTLLCTASHSRHDCKILAPLTFQPIDINTEDGEARHTVEEYQRKAFADTVQWILGALKRWVPGLSLTVRAQQTPHPSS
ncbi:uncharacterized protein L969DRAFT_153243 [Mixia osmundae IAM 14324]|uniref:uncharacterized protein n=1 Tax=Mixia osmundae (strain CBS 9802 / IAM 14324 / JCM 22182 / KY 12970) TaxID=764103 RepID=UPI0004A54CFA|nr:uncharacterized protein L969DRAFT_153243 [Mixia osmundae IAM 14324]KEI42474.1 hypothetical protein L969DRAFT_153243 [Mixia osmundae IAM 14324]